jgi:hypothetical protein
MDRLTRYRTLVKQIVQKHADLLNSQPVPGEEVDCVFDDLRDQYLLLKYGWPRGKHTHYTKIHIRISNGKIWIEEDMTEVGIANELVEAGIPKEDIVLAFNPPELRNIADYAVA